MLQRLRDRKEWAFFATLPKADRLLACTWWAVVLLHGILPALFAIAMGVLVRRCSSGASLAGPLAAVGAIFVLLQVLTPIQTAVSHNLGDRTAAFLYDRLTEACVRPPGMAHLEDPRLAADLTVARDFDLGMTGPPLSYSMDFIAGGLVGMIGGLASAVVLFGFAWWAPLVLGGAWLSTHWLLRESAIWRDRNTDEVRARAARRRLCLSPRRRSAGEQGAAAVRARRLDARTLHRHAHAAAPAPVRGDTAARAAAALEPAHRRRPPTSWSSGRSRPPRRSGRLDLGEIVIYAQMCGRHVAHRVRRAELGARRRLGAGRGRPPAGACDGRRRSADVRPAAGALACRAARSASATSRLRILAAPRSSMAST